MATAFHVMKPVSGKATATAVTLSGKKTRQSVGNPAGDNGPGIVSKGDSMVSGKPS